MENESTTSVSARGPWYKSVACFWIVFVLLLVRLGFVLPYFIVEDPRLWLGIGHYLYLLLPLVFAIIFWRSPHKGSPDRQVGRRLFHCVLIGWAIQVGIRWCILSTAERCLDFRFGGNATTLFGGWLISLFIALPFGIVALLLDAFARRCKA